MGRLRRDIAIQRMRWLFEMAKNFFNIDPALSNRCVEIALRISRRTNIPIPRRYQMMYCKKCHAYLMPGATATVRIRPRRERHIVIKCLNCGRIFRRPLR